MKKSLLILMVVSIALSCRKEAAKTEVQKVKSPPQFSLTFTNPFEYVGVTHNDALDYVVTYLGSGFKTEPAEDQLAALESYANIHSEPFDLTLQHAEDIYNAIPSSGQETYISDRIAAYKLYGGLSVEAGDDLQAMFDELASIKILGTTGYSTIAANISGIEEDVYNDDSYDANEKDIILQVGAMIRNSLSYWINVSQTPEHPRYVDDIGVTGIFGDALADAGAFLEDAIFNNTNGKPKDVGRYASNMHANGH